MVRRQASGQEVKDLFFNFLESYTITLSETLSQGGAGTDDAAPSQEVTRVYVEALQHMKRDEKCSITVNYEHLLEYDSDLADVILENHLYLEPYLRQAFENFIAKHEPGILDTDDARKKEYWISFTDLPRREKLRNLRTTYIGKLISFYGTVTRTSEVRPELYLGTFKCLLCGTTKRNVLQQFRFTEPSICSNSTCNNRKDWQLLKEDSIFVDWQKACVQEISSEVPGGSLPRTMDVILRHDLVERVRPGDKVLFSGDVIVIPDVGAYTAPGEKVVAKAGGNAGAADAGVGIRNQKGEGAKGLGIRELNYRMAFLACDVQTSDQRTGMVNIRGDEDVTGDEVLSHYTDEQVEKLQTMAENNRVYGDMAKSIAPGVFGHDDIKRAILLMLFGGVHKTTKEGINLRGDINVIIVGDPSCGKSQLLKYVSSFLPRAVYTSGKSSSAAGLTATVARDNETGESCIEAGALMLADNGICCIDEFDKMDIKDQVAIHEAMEQQTISLSKAGIQATLNARASILAAANPIGGRYDKSKALKANVMLPPAILSRFDLMHIMVDEPNDAYDYQVASHIVNVHKSGNSAFHVPYTREEMQRYIKYARTFKPEITQESKQLLVESYKRLRGEDAVPGSNSSYRITVRQLEALVRLSQALARVRCDHMVRPVYVREAVRLLKNSIIAIDPPELNLDDVDNEMELQDNADRLAHQIIRDNPDAIDQQAADGAGEIGSNQPEAMAIDQEASAPVMPPADNSATDDVSAEADAEPQPVAAPPAKKKAVTQINQRKYNQIKSVLLTKLREVDEAQGDAATVGGSAGMMQNELIKWFFDQQITKFNSQDEMIAEIVLVEKILQRLVHKEQVVVVIQQPERLPNEDADAYLSRQQQHRILAISPNYSPE